MAAEDELALPQVPEARPDDPEDVSWALSTAEAMWARGDHLEGIKWVRKAAEAASEVEADQRALDLAKAASELTSLVARRSRASVNEGGQPSERLQAAQASQASHAATSITAVPPPDATFTPAANLPPSGIPTTTRSQPAAQLDPARASLAPSPVRSGAPPRAPLTGRVPPRPPAASADPSSVQTAQPPRVSQVPLAPQTPRGGLAPARPAGAGAIETSPHPAVDGEAAAALLRVRDRAVDPDATVVGLSPFRSNPPPAAASSRPPRRPQLDREPPEASTVVARFEDLARQSQPHESHRRERSGAKSAAEWDASPTQNLSGSDELDVSPSGDRATAFVGQAAYASEVAASVPPPPVATAVPEARPDARLDARNEPVPPRDSPVAHARSAPRASLQPPVHDPAIQTTQAVRVIVWRDAAGVHVAPAGTVVSAISIDAVLVVLEQGADLTAWLSPRER
ncbi:MAG: Translation initiation factor 2 [Labilithrix sp.]|nr:Translation initiation factor 2 [Labilithrix sp.]